MTPSSGRPTVGDVNNYFHSKYYNSKKNREYVNKIDRLKEKVTSLKIMKDTINQKSDSLKFIATLLGKCIDNKIIYPDKKKVKRNKIMNVNL